MTAGLTVVALLGGTLLLVSRLTAPATDRTRRRHEARRARYVRSHPRSVSSADIVVRLRTDGVPTEQARFVVDKAAELDITPFTMWLWLEQFDAEALELVVAADLTTRELLGHICNGTVPDLEELRVFAALNGLEVTGPLVNRRLPTTLVRTTLTRRPVLPPIYEPGTLSDGTRLAVHDADPKPRLGGRDGQAA